MSTIADLTNAVTALTTQIGSLVSAINSLPPVGLSSSDQAALDAAVSSIGTGTSELAAAEASLPHA